MKVEKNKVVSLAYELWVDDEDNQKVLFDKAEKTQPLTFIYGNGNLLELFEKNISGLNEGDTFDFTVDYEHGYGDYDENRVVTIPKNIFEVDGKIDPEMLKEGNVLPMQDNEGNRMDGEIVKIEGDIVEMDFNHPLAGCDLFFKGEIVTVRDADAEELAHGHVHGAGGHHHH